MPDPQTPTVAPFPFNQDSADIILRTADQVHYHVHSIILSQASSFFRDMFSLPQPGKTAPSKTSSSDHSDKPIVDITELSDTLYTLLIIIYPVPKPQPTPLPLIEVSLVAAQKYELELPIQALKNDLRACAPILLGNNTLHVWAIACRLRLEDVARYAASNLAFFGFDQLGDTDDAVLRGVSAGDYFRLRSFCRTKFGLAYGSGAMFSFVRPLKTESAPTNIPALGSAANGTTDPAFLTVPYPDVLVRCSNGAEAPAHRCVLAMASPVLRDKIGSKLQPTNPKPMTLFGHPQPATSSLPVLQLDEPSSILWPLLDTCCYPQLHRPEQRAAAPSLSILAHMMAAAEKYKMAHGLKKLRAQWNALAQGNPLVAYLAAAEAGQNDLAKDAARLVLDQPIAVCTQYNAELENAPAQAYHRLLAYYTKCQGAIKGEIDAVKVQFSDNRSVPRSPTEERRWSLHPFLDRIEDSARSGANGIVAATRSLLPEYIEWRSKEASLSSQSRQEAQNLHSLSQSLPTRLENAIRKEGYNEQFFFIEHLTNRAVNPGRTEVVILGDNSVEAFEERPRESTIQVIDQCSISDSDN